MLGPWYPEEEVSACMTLFNSFTSAIDKSSQLLMYRFLEAGWTDVNGWIMNEVYSFIPGKERDRIEHIELLDEQELLKQLLEHYSITVAVNSRGLNSYGLELVGF